MNQKVGEKYKKEYLGKFFHGFTSHDPGLVKAATLLFIECLEALGAEADSNNCGGEGPNGRQRLASPPLATESFCN